jgi:hypothetical protein
LIFVSSFSRDDLINDLEIDLSDLRLLIFLLLPFDASEIDLLGYGAETDTRK